MYEYQTGTKIYTPGRYNAYLKGSPTTSIGVNLLYLKSENEKKEIKYNFINRDDAVDFLEKIKNHLSLKTDGSYLEVLNHIGITPMQNLMTDIPELIQ